MKTNEKRRVVKVLMLAFLLTGLFTACNNDDDDPKPVTISSPTLSAPSEIAATSFKVSWTQVTGAEKYLLDVSTNANFSTTVTGYNKKEVTGTNTSVTGLTAKTKYYVRMYAKKGATLSSASSSKEVTTIE
ncbi:MAG: fibronectin type III domain-containing protein [Marinoscillum sp.]